MNKSHKWPRCSLKWLPAHIKPQEDTVLDVQLCMHYEQCCEKERECLWRQTMYQTRPPVTLITLFQVIMNYKVQHPPHIQQ